MSPVCHTAQAMVLAFDMKRFRSRWFQVGVLLAAAAHGCTKLKSGDDIFLDSSKAGAGSAGVLSPGFDLGSLGGNLGFAGAGGHGGQDPTSCIDPAGFRGLGCNTCEPTDIFSLESSCTDSTCTPFGNSLRLAKLGLDGGLPPVPASSPPGTGGAAAGGRASTGGSAGSAGSSGNNGEAGNLGGGVDTAGAGSGALLQGTRGAAVSPPPPPGIACATLSARGSVVYVTGSSAVKPFLQQVAQQLSTGSGVYIVYTATGSCIGVDAIVNSTPMTSGLAPAPATTAIYWDSSSSTGQECYLPAAGVPADIGISDVFAQTCTGFELTNLDAQGIRDAHGPIQTMTFTVPANSAYTEISAQAAYFVFGFGKDGGVTDPTGTTPIWNDESFIFQRKGSSGTQTMLAAAIGVPSTRWKGKIHQTSDDVALDLQAAGSKQDTASKAIGILAADYIETKNLRAQLHALAFQDSKQACAVYPDSTANAHDKRNVRDGHYPIWGPLHLLYKDDLALANPARQAISDILGYLSGTKPLPNSVKLIDVYAQSGLVPECAMSVTRSKDGGNIVPFSPPSPCNCLFEAKATGRTSCTPCVVQGDCQADQSCSQGYCEQIR